jgi:hypothetical protein
VHFVESSVVKIRSTNGTTRFALDTDEMLLERDWTEGRIEEEQSAVSIHSMDVRRRGVS